MNHYKNIFLISVIMLYFNTLFSQDTIMINRVETIYLKNISINSFDSDFGPSFFGNFLVFSSSQKNEANSNAKWDINGQRFLNFYKGKMLEDGDVTELTSLSTGSNSIYHESNAVFSKKYNKVFFTRNNYYENQKIVERLDNGGKAMRIALFIADYDADGNFYNIVPFPYNSNKYSTGLPTLSLDEKYLYFTSDMPGGFGKTDIYRCEIKEDGSFSKPVNLGANINTSGRDMFPYIAPNGFLYLASDGREGLGKLDLYKVNSSDLDLAGVVNLGEPFNSSRDDFSIIFNADMNSGYFSSNRPNSGVGDDDIYFFYNDTFLDALLGKRNALAQQLLDEVKQDIKVILNVLNEKNKEKINNAKVEIFDMTTGEKVLDTQVDENSQVVFNAQPETEYLIKTEKTLFENKDLTIKTGKELVQNINKVIELKPETTINSENKVVIDLKTIYFDYDSSVITPSAAEELNKVIGIMKKYPTMVIEGTSHTDSRGSDDYNQKLSERRAKSTVQYIVNNGNIDTARMVANGYGEERLTNKCSNGVKCTEAEHSANRRTEFVIINIEDFQ